MNFAETLRSRRAVRRLSQLEVARAVKVSRQTIMSLESGKHLPNLTLARKLATFLEFSIDSLD